MSINKVSQSTPVQTTSTTALPKAQGYWNKLRVAVKGHLEASSLLQKRASCEYDISVLKGIEEAVQRRLASTDQETEGDKYESEVKHLVKVSAMIKKMSGKLDGITQRISSLSGVALSTADKISQVLQPA